MYKVFHSTYHVIFSSEKLNNKSIVVENLNELNDLVGESKSSFLVISNHPYQALLEWYREYEIIEAAGGLVKKNDSYLWIYRNNIWDLPKGKVEKNEKLEQAAMREVQEECGLDAPLEVVRLLYTSYHVYAIKKKNILKRTYWYLMNYKGNGVLIPQLEEGITKAEWVNANQSLIYTKLSFENVKEVWKAL
jgi:8-oxo-dGTP pyrophosphatase MutT (NUDIX family)